MPHSLLSKLPPWRQLVVIAVVLPLGVIAAVLAFAWPAGRIAPRDLPVGIVGAGAGSQQIVEQLGTTRAGQFDLRLYASQRAARAAIEDRDVYGAFVVDEDGVTVLEASAASPAVAQLLTATSAQLAAASGSAPTTPVDVVPTSIDDPRELILSSSLLPLTICSILIAAAIALLIGFRPAWRQAVALVVVSSVAGAGAFLIAQPYLGALPQNHLETFAALAMTILAASSIAAGFIALFGARGMGLAALLLVFIGNPFSGVTSAPELLPGFVDRVGQWLPPGAGASLVRSTAYFDGNGGAAHLAVLVFWTLLGIATIFVGHHTTIRFTAHPDRIAALITPADLAESGEHRRLVAH